MKKIFTLTAASLLGAASLMAMPLDVKEISQLKPMMSLEAQQKARTELAQLKMYGAKEGQETVTRSWTASNGAKWRLILVLSETPLCETLTFTNPDTGEPFQYPFEELPLYEVQCYFAYTPANGTEETRDALLYLAWPCVYYFSQPANTPEDEIDWSPVTLTDMCNETDYVHLFEQTGALANEESWGILPADILEIPSTYDGMTMFTQTGTSVDFLAYDATENNIDVDLNATMKQDPNEGNRSGRMSCKYRGVADRVLGFEATYSLLNKFGEIHLYNDGTISSEGLGDDNPFTETFDEVSCLYVLCGDSKFTPGQVQGGGEFAPNKVGFNWDEMDNNEFNYVRGFVFADPKYGKDPNIDPTELKFQVINPEWLIDEATEAGYISIAPALNSFVPGSSSEAWSVDYGMLVVKGAYLYTPSHESTIAWGTTNGFECNLLDDFRNTVDIQSTAKEIFYHYDKNDITKYRMIPAVGTLPSGAEIVKDVENNAKIMVRNGMISVNAAEKAPIAIYTLDGKLVKAANAKSVNVEANKGVYVVRVGNQAKKVVL